MYTIAKEFAFSAAHHLPHLPAEHPCHRVHGHNYTVTLTIAADAVDGNGFVIDFRALDEFKKWVDGVLDHRDLNEVTPKLFDGSPAPPPRFTTSEELARYLFAVARRMFPGISIIACRVSETPKTWAEYRP